MSALLADILARSSRLAGIVDVSQFDTELAAMQAIRDGTLSSPQRFANLLLISLRITGTGVSYRSAPDEFVHRSPELYLNDEFLERCNGLPVTWEHPKGAVLNSEEFANRVVGMIAMPFIKGDEVWGIAKIYDTDAMKVLETEVLSTSPTVVLKSGDAGGTKFQTPDGSTVLIEGKPYLLDAVAICPLGVWDKGGPPAGVDNESLLRGDSIMDSTESLRRQVADLERRLGPDMSHEMRGDFIAAQNRCDAVTRAYGDTAGAPPFVSGERLLAYRARLASPFQKHSAKYKTVDLNKVQDATVFNSVESEIYADAMAALRNPDNVPYGELREIRTFDPVGRTITSFVGKAGSCWDKFKLPYRFVRAWSDPKTGKTQRVF